MTDKRKLIKAVFFGAVISLLSGIVLMCLAALALLTTGLPQGNLTDYIMLALSALGCIAGGFAAAKINKGAGLIVGAMTGAAVFIILTVTGLIRGTGDFSILSAVRFAALLAGGAIGGALGVREKKRFKI